MKKKSTKNDIFIVANSGTYNRFLLTIATTSFPALYYMIQKGFGFILGFKISLALFGTALILTMLGLAIVIDDPEPKNFKNKCILYGEWFTFILFTIALGLTYYSICIY